MCDLCKNEKVIRDWDPLWGILITKPCPKCNEVANYENSR